MLKHHEGSSGGGAAQAAAPASWDSGGRRTRSGRPRPAASGAALTAVGYCRRSTDRQEQSIPDQKRAIERYCAQAGLELVDWYVDDAISGTSVTGRNAFQALIAAAQEPGCRFGAIVCYDVKRFGRVDNDEAGYYRHLLRQAGVRVLYASENFAGDGTDDLLRPVKQWQAREESKDLSKVTIRGLLSKSTTGFWMGGAPPYGYDLRYESQAGSFLVTVRYHADGSKSVLDDQGETVRTLERGETVAISRKDRARLVPGEPSRVEAVKRIFRMYAGEERGFKAIADALNRERVPPARGPAWAGHYSGQWAMTTVRGILVNPAYRGDAAWNRRTDARFHRIEEGRAVAKGEGAQRRLELNDRADWVVVPGAHEPLVEAGLFERAQRLLAEKTASSTQRGTNTRTGLRAADGPTQPRAVAGGWTGPRARFLLSGLCTCARCGSRYEGYTERSSKKKPGTGERSRCHTYACGGAIRRGSSVCRLGPIKQEVLEEAVIAAVLGHYKRFTGKGGLERLKEVVLAGIRNEQRAAGAELETIAKRLAKLNAVIRNLVDNLTPANRALVDERAAELTAERDALRARASELGRVLEGGARAEKEAAEAHRFVTGLESVLRDGTLEARQAALRRCVRGALVDRESRQVRLEVLSAPVIASVTEELRLPLAKV